MKITKAARARATKQRQLARAQEKKAAAKEKAHIREKANLEKGIAAIERRFEPKIEKLKREIREHEEKAAEHHHAAAVHSGHAHMPHPIHGNVGTGRERPAAHRVNPEGLTWTEWADAVGIGYTPHSNGKMVKAWEAGEDPSEYR